MLEINKLARCDLVITRNTVSWSPVLSQYSICCVALFRVRLVGLDYVFLV